MKKRAIAFVLTVLTLLIAYSYLSKPSEEKPTGARFQRETIKTAVDNVNADRANTAVSAPSPSPLRRSDVGSTSPDSANQATLRWLRVQQSKKLGEAIRTLALSSDVMDQIIAVRLASFCVVAPAIGEDVRQTSSIQGRLNGPNAHSRDMVELAVAAGQELQRQCARSGNDQLELVEAMMKNSSVYADSFAQHIGRIRSTKSYGDLSAAEARATDSLVAEAESNLPLLHMYGARLLAGPLRNEAWESLQSAQERSAAVELIACAMGNDCREGGLTMLYLCYTEIACTGRSVEDAMRTKLANSNGSWERAVNASAEIANALRRNNRTFFGGLR